MHLFAWRYFSWKFHNLNIYGYIDFCSCFNHRNGLITNGKAHKSTRSSINPTTKEVINFVDVNAVPKWEVESKRATTEVHSVCSEICRECIINETKLLGLKKKNDDIRKQYVELEKENESLKSQLAMHISTMIDTNDDISSGCNENCNICFATLTSHELCTHICIDLDEVTCEYCSETFKSINDLWNHLTNATIHDNAKSYQCDNCTKSFSAAILLKCHESTEHFELDLNTSLNKSKLTQKIKKTPYKSLLSYFWLIYFLFSFSVPMWNM